MVEVVVEHDYIAKEPNELTITKGDIIRDVFRKQGGWWEGTLNERIGLFPDNFVKVIMDRDAAAVVLRNKGDATRIRQCRVVFSYKQDHEDELDLKVGDVIDILGEEEEGWWRGCLHGKQGVFPSNFVEEITSSNCGSWEKLDIGNDVPTPPVHSAAKTSKLLCEVKFAYKAQNEDELTLKEGDIVTLLTKDGQDPGWWKGELNGLVGVFPDNFVVLIGGDEHLSKDEKKAKNHTDLNAIKTSMVSSQRKSLELKNIVDKSADTNDSTKPATPPVPGKKPLIPLKKSPSSSSSSGGGIFHGLKKKIVDAVDGATGSKSAAPPKTETVQNQPDNVFDEVVRRPLLADVRASRPKAPGRRPPSVVFKEGEPDVVNGNTDQSTLDILTEQLSNSDTTDTSDNKPKLREWEKHKAPWLEEMKLNQAKRTSTSPGPEHKLKLTPTDKNPVDSTDDQPKPNTNDINNKATTPSIDNMNNNNNNNIKELSSPVDSLPKSINNTATNAFSNNNIRLKTPPNELDKTPIMIRNKHNLPTMPPARPQSIQNICTSSSSLSDSSMHLQKPIVSKIVNKTPSPSFHKSTSNSDIKTSSNSCDTSGTEAGGGVVSAKQYVELVERIAKLEELVAKQNEIYMVAIDELRGRLQLESDMRIALQAKLQKD